MKHTAALLLFCAFLMGCDAASNPFAGGVDASEGAPDGGDTDGDTGDGGTDGGGTDGGTDGDGTGGTSAGGGSVEATDTSAVPSDVAGAVTRVTFDAAAGTLTVTGVNLDNVPVETQYTRAPGLDRNGFTAYTTQESILDRHFTAYVRESGSVRASVVASPSPRNRVFKGAFFERDGAYDPPDVTEDTGLVTYAGSYIGLTNIGATNGVDLLSTQLPLEEQFAIPEELRPGQSLPIDGDVLLNADFADNTVEGNILNRRLLDTDGDVFFGLPSLVLVVSPIDNDGAFQGNVEYDIRDSRSNTDALVQVGTYAGIIGGENGSQIAGGINLTEFDGVGNPLELEAELESGAFVLDACTAANSNPICALER